MKRKKTYLNIYTIMLIFVFLNYVEEKGRY